MFAIFLLLAAAAADPGVASVTAAPTALPQPLDYGTPVAYEDGVRIGEEMIREGLADPDSTKFKWPYSFVPFSEKLWLSKRTTGYATCMTYNAKNLYGGYVGYRQYRILIRDGKVIDFMPVSDLKFVPDICKELAEKYGMVAVSPDSQ